MADPGTGRVKPISVSLCDHVTVLAALVVLVCVGTLVRCEQPEVEVPSSPGSSFDFKDVDKDGSGCVEGPEEMQNFRLQVGRILGEALHLNKVERALRAGRITHSADVNADGRICQCDLLSILLAESTRAGKHRHAFRVYEDGSFFDDVDLNRDAVLDDVTERPLMKRKLAQCVTADQAEMLVRTMASMEKDDGRLTRSEYLQFLKSATPRTTNAEHPQQSPPASLPQAPQHPMPQQALPQQHQPFPQALHPQQSPPAPGNAHDASIQTLGSPQTSGEGSPFPQSQSLPSQPQSFSSQFFHPPSLPQPNIPSPRRFFRPLTPLKVAHQSSLLPNVPGNVPVSASDRQNLLENLNNPKQNQDPANLINNNPANRQNPPIQKVPIQNHFLENVGQKDPSQGLPGLDQDLPQAAQTNVQLGKAHLVQPRYLQNDVQEGSHLRMKQDGEPLEHDLSTGLAQDARKLPLPSQQRASQSSEQPRSRLPKLEANVRPDHQPVQSQPGQPQPSESNQPKPQSTGNVPKLPGNQPALSASLDPKPDRLNPKADQRVKAEGPGMGAGVGSQGVDNIWGQQTEVEHLHPNGPNNPPQSALENQLKEEK